MCISSGQPCWQRHVMYVKWHFYEWRLVAVWEEIAAPHSCLQHVTGGVKVSLLLNSFQLGMSCWKVRELTRPSTAIVLRCVKFMTFTWKEGIICIQFEACQLRFSPSAPSRASPGCSYSQEVYWSACPHVLLSDSPHLVWKKDDKNIKSPSLNIDCSRWNPTVSFRGV